MADIDVSELMDDPDFTDEVILITRVSSVGANGRLVLVESDPATVDMIVQRPKASVLAMFPDMVQLAGVIQVWYGGHINAQSLNGYSDVIVWDSRRYQTQEIVFDGMNWGEGYTSALCILESVNNRDDE